MRRAVALWLCCAAAAADFFPCDDAWAAHATLVRQMDAVGRPWSASPWAAAAKLSVKFMFGGAHKLFVKCPPDWDLDCLLRDDCPEPATDDSTIAEIVAVHIAKHMGLDDDVRHTYETTGCQMDAAMIERLVGRQGTALYVLSSAELLFIIFDRVFVSLAEPRGPIQSHG